MTITHLNIYDRFLIEYDKANITSSFPSLTKHEAVALLNKAYSALISQKLIGNNPRRASFEVDIKAIEDLQPLVTTTITPKVATYLNNGIRNERVTDLPEDMMYYLQSRAVDNNGLVYNVDLISHQSAQNFKVVSNNVPWIENPVAYLENKHLHVLADIDLFGDDSDSLNMYITYIKMPELFEVEEASTDEPNTGDSGNSSGGSNNPSEDDSDIKTIVLNINPEQPQVLNFSGYGFTQADLDDASNGTVLFLMNTGSNTTDLKIVLIDNIPEMNSDHDYRILSYFEELVELVPNFSGDTFNITHVAYLKDEEDISVAAPLVFFSMENTFVNCIEPDEDIQN